MGIYRNTYLANEEYLVTGRAVGLARLAVLSGRLPGGLLGLLGLLGLWGWQGCWAYLACWLAELPGLLGLLGLLACQECWPAGPAGPSGPAAALPGWLGCFATKA